MPPKPAKSARGYLAKAMAAKSRPAKKVKKEEKATPSRRKRTKQVAGVAEVQKEKASASTMDAVQAVEDNEVVENLGFPRNTVSSLITSLKYQLKAKKTTEAQKADAAATLKETHSCSLFFFLTRSSKTLNYIDLAYAAGLRIR